MIFGVTVKRPINNAALVIKWREKKILCMRICIRYGKGTTKIQLCSIK